MPAGGEGAALVCALPLEDVAAFSSLRINLSQDLRGPEQRRANLQACRACMAAHHHLSVHAEVQGPPTLLKHLVGLSLVCLRQGHSLVQGCCADGGLCSSRPGAVCS